jgi:acyl-CoA synthetase (NDP forming)
MLDSLFRPKSVAVIGASNRRLTIGYRIIQNLLDSGYNGPVYPIHPKAAFIKSIPAYPTILDVPGDVELVHVVVKSSLVPMVLKDCGKKGVKVAIINTAGFREVGGEGIKAEEEIVKIAKEAGIRLFGPNCQGIMNSDPEVNAYCNFTFTKLRPGHVSLLAQSGGVGEVINNKLYELDAGIRMYASNGNACDVSIPEIIEYWGNDPGTRVIICHIESLPDPALFLKVAKEVSKKKPILGMKTGRTMAGAKAVSSHTGGLVKQDTTTELIFEEAGVISFKDEEDLCQAAYAISRQPIPRGNRIGIMTNTGGPGIISADELIEAGCDLPNLSEKTQTKLREVLHAEATISNPVDVIATAGPEHYKATVEALLEDDNIDSVLINFITPFFVDCEGVAREIAALAPKTEKPIMAIVMTEKEGWAKTISILRDAGIPVFDFPETGAKALAAMSNYALAIRRPDEAPAEFSDIKRDAAAKTIRETLDTKREFVPQKAAIELLEAYGIGAPKSAEVGTLDEACKAADAIGYPVLLKVESEDVVHKSDSGGVALNLKNRGALEAVFKEMEAKFKGARFLVAQFIGDDGVEVLLGAKKEDGLGHMVVFGLGGIFVEVLQDAAFALAPLSKSRAIEIMKKLKGYPLLEGVRGKSPVDLDLLADALCRLGRLVTDNPQIVELDLNPVLAFGKGKAPIAVDVRIKVK